MLAGHGFYNPKWCDKIHAERADGLVPDLWVLGATEGAARQIDVGR